ncbi:DinB family protein [Nocardioides lijunqiniae]|uniref:DinB family protein n=1 Tax=Nocardioides lijunqiniae TaxID=2760832 RepID=UPI001878173F|nr:DinB family protein [Nocardioides lijunqiniae]
MDPQHPDDLRAGRLHHRELAGLEIRDCEVSGLRLVDCYGSDVHVAGDFERVVVNDVDVTAYVETELDRQHPVRVLAREAATVRDYQVAWEAVESMWRATLDHVRSLPEALLHQRVDGEWSFVETQRHLLLASDAWLGNAVLEEDSPLHPLGLPHGGMPPDVSASLGLTLTATPTLQEVLEPRRARMDTVRDLVVGLTDRELDRVCSRKPAEPYPDQEYVVRRCLTVVLKEEAEHHRYAVRDLARLTTSR